jgi:hypothetical protein
MSETTIAGAKPGKTAAAPAPTAVTQARPEQKLRDTKPRSFAPSSLKPLGYGETEIMTIAVPADWNFEDLMKPVAWVSVAGPIAANAIKTQVDRVGSLIYATSAGGKFMAWLRIDEIVRDEMKNPCGVKVMCIGPSIDIRTGRPCPMDLKTGLPWVDPEKPREAEAA